MWTGNIEEEGNEWVKTKMWGQMSPQLINKRATLFIPNNFLSVFLSLINQYRESSLQIYTVQVSGQ